MSAVDIPVVGDAKIILKELAEKVEFQDRSEWFEQIAKWKKQYPFAYDKKSDQIKPQCVIEEIYNQTKGDAIITTGVGQHQMWTAQFYKFSKAKAIYHFRRAWHDGIRDAGSYRCTNRHA